MCFGIFFSEHQQSTLFQIFLFFLNNYQNWKSKFNPTTSTSARISKLKLQPFQDRRTISMATFMYKIMNCLVDLNPVEGTLTTGNRHSRGQPKRLLVLQSRADVNLHPFFPLAIRLWNRLPTQVFSADTLTDFKAAVEGWVWPTGVLR